MFTKANTYEERINKMYRGQKTHSDISRTKPTIILNQTWYFGANPADEILIQVHLTKILTEVKLDQNFKEND